MIFLTQRHKKRIMIAGGILILLLIITAIIFAVAPAKQEQKIPSPSYEITETDIFSLPGFKAADITVKGVKLGDPYETMIEKLGTPDKQLPVNDQTINVEYGERLKLSDTGLIIQLKDNSVIAFTFKQPFNPLLIGKTKIVHSKEDIYLQVLGKPDNILFVPITPTSVQAYKVLEYQDKGVYVLLKKNEQNGFTLRSIPLKA